MNLPEYNMAIGTLTQSLCHHECLIFKALRKEDLSLTNGCRVLLQCIFHVTHSAWPMSLGAKSNRKIRQEP